MNTDKHLDALAPLLETAEEAGRDEAAQAALIAGLSPEARRAWEALEATARLSAAQPSPRLTPARRAALLRAAHQATARPRPWAAVLDALARFAQGPMLAAVGVLALGIGARLIYQRLDHSEPTIPLNPASPAAQATPDPPPPTPDPPPPAPEAPTVTLAPSLKGEAKAEAEGRPLERDALEENATSTGPQGASPSPHEAKAPKARRVAKGAKAAPRRRARSRGRDADRDADRDAEHERARRFAPPPSMGGDAAPPPSPQRVEPVAAPSAHTPSAPARPAIAPSEPAAPTREDEMSARGAKRQDEALADERPFDVAKDDLAVGDVVEDVEPRAALEAGLGALARGEHQSAWALLDAFLRAHPTHPRADEARFGAGQAAEALGWWSIARAAYAQIKAAPWAERAKARLDALRASPP